MAGIAMPQGILGVGKQRISYSQQAREYLAELLLGKIVHLRVYGLDSDDRVSAEVYLNGVNINLEMLRAGFAGIYCRELPESFPIELYRRAGAEASKAGRSMWASSGR